jgi:hypothetical protein
LDDDTHVGFGQKFPGEKGSVRWCIVVMQQPVFSAKIRGKVFSHFYTVTVKCHSICGIGCLACEDEFYVNIPVNAKENDEHVLEFVLHFQLRIVALSQGHNHKFSSLHQ